MRVENTNRYTQTKIDFLRACTSTSKFSSLIGNFICLVFDREYLAWNPLAFGWRQEPGY